MDEDSLHYERIVIEMVLVPMIQAIQEQEGDCKTEQIKQQIEEAFEIFLQDAKQFEGCPGFKEMTVEELKKEYDRIIGQSQNLEREP